MTMNRVFQIFAVTLVLGAGWLLALPAKADDDPACCGSQQTTGIKHGYGYTQSAALNMLYNNAYADAQAFCAYRPCTGDNLVVTALYDDIVWEASGYLEYQCLLGYCY